MNKRIAQQITIVKTESDNNMPPIHKKNNLRLVTCPKCGTKTKVRVFYYTKIINRNKTCENCKKTFKFVLSGEKSKLKEGNWG